MLTRINLMGLVNNRAMNLLGAGELFTTGSVFYVDSVTGSNGNTGLDPKFPLASIDTAIGACTADKGDIIVVMPKHVETVIAAAGIALDVAGVSIMGMGSPRPQINFTTATTASFRVTAANCSISNVRFTGGIDALVSPVQIQAADFKMIDCEYRDVTGQATDVILTTAAANRLLIQNFRYEGDTAAGTNSGIAIVGGDRIVIDGLVMDGNFAVGGIDIRTTATTDLEIRNAQCRNRNSGDIFLVDTITASTGMIGPNIFLRIADNAANITEAITGATFVVFDPVYVVNLAGEKAMLINWVASTDA